jgi:hypothetical protein
LARDLPTASLSENPRVTAGIARQRIAASTVQTSLPKVSNVLDFIDIELRCHDL